MDATASPIMTPVDSPYMNDYMTPTSTPTTNPDDEYTTPCETSEPSGTGE